MRLSVLKEKIFTLVSKTRKVPNWFWYLAIATFVITQYTVTRELMSIQSAWLNIIKSGGTVNFAIFLVIYWNILDRITERLGFKVKSLNGLIIWLAGFTILIVFLRLTGNLETIFDARVVR